jgi:hypothetical protein
MPVMNVLFCGLHLYVFVLALLITLSTWGSRLRWLGVLITALALLFALQPVFSPGWLTPVQLPGKFAIAAGALAMTILARRTDTRYIGVLLTVAAGGAAAAHLVAF